MQNKLPIGLTVGGILGVGVMAIVSWVIIPNFIDDQIKKETQLVEGTEVWKQWENITIPMFFQFYIFNMTNPDEFRLGKPPVFQELGPYTYEEKRYKYGFVIDEEEDTITYRQPITYYYREDLSVGSDLDKFTIINVPIVMIAAIVPYYINLPGFVYDIILSGQDIVLKDVTVRDFLFEGVSVSWVMPYYRIVKALWPGIDDILPQEFHIESESFSLWKARNGSDEGLMTVNRGVKDHTMFGQLMKWNDEPTLSFWDKGNPNSSCNKLEGSDGSIYPPFMTKDTVIRLFNKEVCRSLWAVFEKEVEFKDVKAYRFTAPMDELEDPRVNPENMCFCPDPGELAQGCLKRGAIQLKTCQKNAPIVLSLPHFLYGNIDYQYQSYGMAPDPEKHDIYIDIQPRTGIVLRGHKRVQIGVELKPYPQIALMKNLRNMLFPVVWGDESAEATDDLIGMLHDMFLTPLLIVEIAKWVLFAIFIGVAFAGVFIFIRRRRQGIKTV